MSWRVFEGDAQFRGDLLFFRLPAQFRDEFGNGLFDLSRLCGAAGGIPSPVRAGCRGWRRECGTWRMTLAGRICWIVTADRFDQSDHAGIDQVFERHVLGQALINPPGNVMHLGQLLEDELVALPVSRLRSLVCQFCLVM